MNSVSPHAVLLQLEINDVTRAWGLEVDRMELAVEAVLQPPQGSLAGPSLDDSLQQLALHFLGGGMSAGAGGALPPGPGEEKPRQGGGSAGLSLVRHTGRALLLALLTKRLCAVHTLPICSGHPDCTADPSSGCGESARSLHGRKQQHPERVSHSRLE